MIERILQFSLNQRLLVLFLTSTFIGLGIWYAKELPIDAVPDVTNVQVQINTAVPALAPVEVEKLVTYPIEVAMGGLPDVDEVRSLSRYGLSQVTVVFKDHVDIYFARQLVLERLQTAKEEIPEGLGTPTMGPIATGLGEIYLYTIEGDGKDPIELRSIQDYIVKPQLRTTPGVTEVNSIGGYIKQYQVLPDPNKLIAYDVTLRDLLEALEENNANTGGGYIEHREEQYLVRGLGLVQSIEDIQNIVIAQKKSVPVYVRDVAEVVVGPEIRTGSATKDGKETVIGTAIMLKGENSLTVATNIRERLMEISKSLPEGVRIETVYDRTDLVNKTIHTVQKNLVEGGLLVIAVLFFLLGNIKAGLIAASVIPLSMLFAMSGMALTKTSANLMSLGAIDFGLIVDGTVIIVENCVRRLSEARRRLGRNLTGEERTKVVFEASKEVRKATMFGELIIMIVYLPILTLQGIEGKMFRPMALTVVMALLASLLLTITVVPALCSLFLRNVTEKENRILGFALRIYKPAFAWVLVNPRKVFGAALLFVILTLGLFPFLGSEFIPRLNEESLSIQSMKPTGISLTESTKLAGLVEKAALQFPEVLTSFSRTGTAEIATDPMGPNVTDTYIMMKGKVKDREKLIEEMSEEISKIPGMGFSFSQPIELRVNELISGVRSDIALKLFGDDLDTLKTKGDEIARLLSDIQGAEEARAEQVSGLPVLQIEVDREKIARYGINVSDVLSVIETAIAGKTAGEIYEGIKRFDLVLKYPEKYRNSPAAIGNILISAPSGHKIPLAQLAEKIAIEEGPSQISHEHARRRISIEVNVRGRDIGGFVQEAQKVIEDRVKLPAGYYLEWGGQFENLEAARKRLLIVVPISLALIFTLLFFTFNSVKQALMVFTGIPLAVTGGILALFIRQIHFSISAGIGFIALFGVAMLNGVVMVTYINRLRAEGMSLEEAVRSGAETRLRPVLMTALVASLGFVPMAFAHGTGAEVQQPLATVVIGGLISSTFLTLLVLPLLYLRFETIKQGNLK